MYTQYRIQDGQRGGGARNMKYKGPPVAAIFFMTSFNRDRGGGMAPLAPPPWIRSWHITVIRHYMKREINQVLTYIV